MNEQHYFQVPELHRTTHPHFQSYFGDRFGFFQVPIPKTAGAVLNVIASDGETTGWEHVSVVRWFGPKSLTPTWDDMALIKSLFWHSSACVVQYHPPESEYVNNHPNCLHLWRKVGHEYPLPPSILVGIK